MTFTTNYEKKQERRREQSRLRELRRAARFRIDFVRTLASFSLKDLENQYVSLVESWGEADTPEAQSNLRQHVDVVEAVAKYRFGDQWVRP